jgi:hypothetical protein
MNDLYFLLKAEGLKLERTLALRLAICGPMTIVLLVFGMYAEQCRAWREDRWRQSAQLHRAYQTRFLDASSL